MTRSPILEWNARYIIRFLLSVSSFLTSLDITVNPAHTWLGLHKTVLWPWWYCLMEKNTAGVLQSYRIQASTEMYAYLWETCFCRRCKRMDLHYYFSFITERIGVETTFYSCRLHKVFALLTTCRKCAHSVLQVTLFLHLWLFTVMKKMKNRIGLALNHVLCLNYISQAWFDAGHSFKICNKITYRQ